ncbi:hypothetical protein HOY80DRAFT_1136815 [Tuber brumale]|nr:hypothetical protein HOY80DRAFT_1136815 [Tuber brumale]
MTDGQTDSWGDSIRFSQFLATGREHQGTSPHAEMSWTACYDDDCKIHLHEKEASGWFPKRKSRKGRRNGKKQGARRDAAEDHPKNSSWGDGGDGGGCPIPTDEEVKAILARKAAREAAQASKVGAATVPAGVEQEAQIDRR